MKIRIVWLSSKLKSINAIVRQLQDEGIKRRHQTVASILKRYNEDGSLTDEPALGSKPILALEQMTFIDEKMEANDKLTAVGKNLSEMITFPFTCIVGKLAMEFSRDKGIKYWPTPAKSPNLKPIEKLWHELKHFLRVVVKPMNKEELLQGIH